MAFIQPFQNPIFVTQPLLPSLGRMEELLGEIWESRWITNAGEKSQELEEKLRNFLKIPYLSLINNGTTALTIALKALDLEGEVITTPFTFSATVHAIQWMGLKPVFVDIDPTSLCIDPKKIDPAISSKTSAILPVHVFGHPCDVETIQQIALKNGLKVIYDAAHAFGTETDQVGIGNFGDITMFSFHATKLFNTAEGGALSCKDEMIKKRIDRIRNFGMGPEGVEEVGINGKMNELQAAMGLAVLEEVEREREKRAAVEKVYLDNLPKIPGIYVFRKPSHSKNSYQYFAIQIIEEEFGKSRDWVFQELKKFNIFARRYFFPLCSHFSCYHGLPSANPENLPVATKIESRVLALPFFGELGLDRTKKICEILYMLQSKHGR